MRVCDIADINRISVSEKIFLVEEFWDSITSDPKKLLTLDELQSRIEENL